MNELLVNAAVTEATDKIEEKQEKNFPFFRILLKHIWFIIIFTIAATFVGAGYAALIREPVYTAQKDVIFVTQIVYEDSNGDPYISVRDNLNFARVYLPTLAANAVSPTYVNEASDIYGEKGAVKAGAIKLKYDEDSLIFSISYTDSSETAAKEKLAAIIQSLDKNVNFMGADEARVTPVQNEATVIADNGIVKCSLIGFAVGLVVAVAIALVTYILDNTVKDAEELEEISGANLLAKISYDDGKNK